MDGEDQAAASKISEMDTPLDHAQEEEMPLVEPALLDSRRMAAGDRPGKLRAERCKRSNQAAEAFQLRISASARKNLCHRREEN